MPAKKPDCHPPSETNTALARLEERLEFLVKKTTELTDRIRELEDKIDTLEEVFAERFVTKDEFAPVRSIVYGIVGIILVAVAGAVVALVLRDR